VNRSRIELWPVTPWSLVLFDRIPLPPFWGGVVVALAVFAFFLLYSIAFGASLGRLVGFSFEWGWVAELIQDGFLGFAIAVTAASVRGARAEIRLLQPARAPELEREVLRYPRALLACVGFIGVLSATPTVLSASMWEGGRRPEWTHPTVLWLFARNAVTWSIVLRGMALELVLGRRFSALADAVVLSDPLDRTAFAPFARRALRNVLLWMLLAAWVSLTYVGPGWAVGSLLALGLATLAGFAVTAFLLPLLGPHRRLRDAKRAELARVRSALLAARDAALCGDGAAPPGRLADLIAYEARVADASEWPLEASTVLRFALYLMLGLGSWIGAGLVQHLLERELG
jgi:hypothetical protein